MSLANAGRAASYRFTSNSLTRRAVLLFNQRCGRALSTQQPNHEDYDVVIVGGGPAGLALASALGSSQLIRENLRVALVEAGDLDKVRTWSPEVGVYSNRVSSLTNASQAFLKSIGAWNHVELERTAPVEEMQVWDGISDARITFSADDLGLAHPEDGMARLTENLNLQRALLRHLGSIPEVHLFDKTKVKTITNDSEDRASWPLLVLDNERVLRARLLVGADGPNSPVRAYSQIPSFGWSYPTQAIVATLNHPPRGAFESPNTTAYQRFLPTGPIAFLPISPTSSSLVWSTTPTLAKALLASDTSVLASMINAAFRLPYTSVKYLHDRIREAHSLVPSSSLTHTQIVEEIAFRERSDGIDSHSSHTSLTPPSHEGVSALDAGMFPPFVQSIQSGSAASFPLRYAHTESYLGDRTVLVGDAAHTVHPLAGQGLNMGLADVECLAGCLQSSLELGGDVGGYTSLLPYAQERYLANHTLMSAIDKLHKVYSTTAEPIVWARSVGVEVLNELDTLKAAVILSAGGGGAGSKVGGGGRGAGWEVAARAVETLVSASSMAKMVGQTMGGIAGVGLSKLLKGIQENVDQSRTRK